MTKAHYVICLLLTMSWSKDLDEAAKQNTIIGDANPQKEDNSNYCNVEQEMNCQYSSKSLLLNILSSKSRKENFETSKCTDLEDYFGDCPPGLTSHKPDGDDDIYCYELKLKQNFEKSCTYRHSIPYIKWPIYFKDMSYNHDIWINIFRNTSSGYPNFIYGKNYEEYGKPFYKVELNEGDLNSSCIVISEGDFKRVSCSDRFDTLCVYSHKTLQSKKLIGTCNSSGYTNCMVSDFYSSKPKCFCKKINTSMPNKEQFCTKLAEPIYEYQSKLLYKFLRRDKNICWMGMQRNSSLQSYYWMTTNQTVEYTYWVQSHNCKHSEGAIKFDVRPCGGWMLCKDKTLNCALCEVALDLKKPSLTLEHNILTNRVELTVKNFDSISGTDSVDIYCFSDSNDDEFTHTVNYKLFPSITDTKIAYLLGITRSPSRYWCHAFEYSSDNVIKSNIVVASVNFQRYNQEFVITVRSNFLKYFPNRDPFVQRMHVTICRNLRGFLGNLLYNCREIVTLRPVSGRYGNNYQHLFVNYHLTTSCPGITVEDQYDEINKVLFEIDKKFKTFSIESFGRYDICLRNITLSPDNQTLIWPSTAVGASATPTNVLCLDKSRGMLPVTRKCLGTSSDGATWGEPVGECHNDTEYSETTHELFNLAHGNASTQEITQSLLKLTENSISDEPIDVHLTTSALERVSVSEDEKINENNFSAIINNMMSYDNETLKVAQSVLNSTDRLLSLLDSFIVNHIDRPWIKILPRLVIQISDLRKSDIRGLAMYNTMKKNNFEKYKIVQLYQNTSFDNIIKNKQLDTSVLFPSEEVNKIKEEFANDTTPIMLVIVVFYDDILFQETDNKLLQHSQSKVVGVIVPGYKNLKSPIKIALRTREKYENKKDCSFWNYGLNDEMVSAHGQWETSASSKTELLEICEFYHMTHFGLLIKGDLVKTPHDFALSIITAVGSALSLIGIIPIFLTAIAFKSWRNKAGNVILINFCIAITIQIALMFSLYAITEDGIACKAIAACLHYIVVSEFCWMFVVAMLQYRRFVMVFTPQESNIVLKCIIAGWIVPLLPVVVTLSVSMQSYSLNAQNFCYISGNYLIYTYICPILFILLCNAVVFITIICSVSRQTAACVQKHRSYKLQILLGLFLFFVLGMTWLFGFLGALIDALWLTYIFCITATLRGIVLFLFFIAGNEETSLMWKKRITYHIDGGTRKPSKPNTSDTILSTD